MRQKIKIYEQGLEEYPKSSSALGNFLMLLWIALGTVSFWFLHPLSAWIYLAFALIMVFVVLRKALCVNCYYYGKWCPIGWSRLAALFFKKGDIEKFNTSVGQKLAPLAYGILSAVPVVFIATSIFQEFSAVKIIVLVLLLSISFYSGTLGRKKSCARCKMRLICKGCAAKCINISD